MKKTIKCEYCNMPATHFNETRVKSDGIHQEIVSVCDKHMLEKIIKNNKANRI